jgi:dienelactone hydrolase
MVGSAVHLLDRVAARSLSRIPPERRIFRGGWGDGRILDHYRAVVDNPPPIPDTAVHEGPRRQVGGLVVRDLTFTSPGDFLPPQATTAAARLVTPEPGSGRLVVLMAAWNDVDYRTRWHLAQLLAKRGIASVMLQQPFYGIRGPLPGDGQPITTVSDFAVMGRTAVLEGRVLAAHFHERSWQVGVSGYSMGGNLAALVAVTAPFPLACAPLAAPHSPGPPFVHGLLRHAIDWNALGGDDPGTRKRLSDFLHATTILHFPAPDHTRAAVMVAATRDGYVPTAAVQAVHRHWPGSEVDWVNGGHASLLWQHKDRLVAGVERSFDRLEALI